MKHLETRWPGNGFCLCIIKLAFYVDGVSLYLVLQSNLYLWSCICPLKLGNYWFYCFLPIKNFTEMLGLFLILLWPFNKLTVLPSFFLLFIQACHLLQHYGRLSPFCSLHAGGLLDTRCRTTSEKAQKDVFPRHHQARHWLVWCEWDRTAQHASCRVRGLRGPKADRKKKYQRTVELKTGIFVLITWLIAKIISRLEI